jgi:mRNA interferase MazF
MQPKPALVWSSAFPPPHEDRALATLVPHTTSPRGSRFEVEIKVRYLKEGVFDGQSLVTVPHAKLIRKLGTLTTEQVEVVEDAICLWLGL